MAHDSQPYDKLRLRLSKDLFHAVWPTIPSCNDKLRLWLSKDLFHAAWRVRIIGRLRERSSKPRFWQWHIIDDMAVLQRIMLICPAKNNADLRMSPDTTVSSGVKGRSSVT